MPTRRAIAFPNAQPANTGQLASGSALSGQDFNYIRNSVKVVVDAYTGQMTFYVSDPSDPIIRTYENVFPQMFTPMSAMPADLKAHLRVPEDLFDVETREYARYHVTDPADVLQQHRPVDRAARRGRDPEPAQRGLLRRDAPARRARNPSSCCSSRWSRPAART